MAKIGAIRAACLKTTVIIDIYGITIQDSRI